MDLVGRLGLTCIEASADTEADPLYSGEEYFSDWVEEVARSEKASGMKVVNLYSGHGTYTTLGLAHTDSRVRERMRERWVKPMVRAAAQLHAGLGFYCHAFPDVVLQDPDAYAGELDRLYDQLAQIASYAAEQGAATVGVEQMYSPHQCPWTIAGARGLMREVLRRCGSPFYLTIDTGHQTGQRRYLRPGPAELAQAARGASGSKRGSAVWLGSQSARELFQTCTRDGGKLADRDLALVLKDLDRHPYLFSEPEDADTYSWLASLGCYSPIVHLQQVTGDASAHLPFTAETRAGGLIQPDKVLRSLLQAYKAPEAPGMPKKSESIYLTLEIFSGTAETGQEIQAKLRDSVEYWREYVPRDGARLDDLVG
jgi:hypothetical protein